MNVTNNVVVTPAHLLTLLPGAIPPESTNYFYGKITREQAEELLFTHGANEGLFLLRESVNRNYAVSICHLGRVHHYNVERQTDCSYRIQTGHKFVGPVELVQHHSTQLDGFLTLAQLPLNRPVGMSPIVLQGLNANDLEHNLRLKAIEMGLKGQSVEEALNGPMRNHLRFLVIKDLHLLQPWYHHTIRRYEAESRLASEGNQDGAFLVRYRKEDRTYVLSLTSQNEPKHYRIEEYLSRWSIEGGQYFETIMEAYFRPNQRRSSCKSSTHTIHLISPKIGFLLIDHYHFRQDGLLCKLQKPIPVSNFTRSFSGSGGVSKITTKDDFKIPIISDKSQQCKPQTITSNNWNGSHSLPSLNSIPVTGVNPFNNITTTNIQSINSSNEIIRTTGSIVPGANTTITANEQSGNFINRYPNPQTSFTPSIVNLSSSRQTPLKMTNSNNDNYNNNKHLSSNRLIQTSTAKVTTTTPAESAMVTTSNSGNFTNAMLIGSTLIPQMALFDREINEVTKLMNGQATSVSNNTHNTTMSSNANVKDSRVGCLKPIRLNEPLTTMSKAFAEVDNAIAQVVSNAFSSSSTNRQLISPITGTITNVITTTTTVMTTMIAPSTDNLKNNSCVNTHFIHNHCNHTTANNTIDHHNDNVNIIDKRITNTIINREFPTQTLHFPPILDTPWEEPDCSEGGGNFGHVVKGLYRTPSGQEVPVAVKTLKPNQIVNSGENFPYINISLSCLLFNNKGVCKEEQFMLVLELAPLGPINKYLKKRPDVSVHTLTELMHQVALGMAYLESCKFVHRDLAARNVLLVTRHFAKISDFGMSKALNFGSDYYRAATAGKWPLKWYAPECIYYFRFDSKSDVWSYGITLWEVYSYGERPYRDMKGAQILAMLDQGLRLSRPSRCPESIYSVMQQCWNFEGVHRPTFAELVLTISRILRAMPSPQTNICIPNHHHSNNSGSTNINANNNNNVLSSNLSTKFDHLHSPTHQHNNSNKSDNTNNTTTIIHNNNTGLHPIEFSPLRRLGGIGTSASSGGSGVNSGGSDGTSF
uniref:Tyrosine-protein kinase n=1 Tax=Schistosoma haematobium TaxID=6185 RepID=A0A094ZLS0_SCHHA